jgi:hypothetical protein
VGHDRKSFRVSWVSEENRIQLTRDGLLGEPDPSGIEQIWAACAGTLERLLATPTCDSRVVSRQQFVGDTESIELYGTSVLRKLKEPGCKAVVHG